MCKVISSNELWDGIRKNFIPNNTRKSGKLLFNKEYANMQIDYFNTGTGITYSSFMANFHNDTIIQGYNHLDMSFLCFNIGNSIYMENSHKKEKIKFDSNTCWSGRQNKDKEMQGTYYKNKQYLAHYITFDNNLFDNIMYQQSQVKEIKPIVQNDDFSINFHTNISMKQTFLLNDLGMTSNFTGKLQELYFESKVLDLVYTTINEVPQDTQSQIYLSTKDIECLQKAKNILLENMTNPPSLKELSRKSTLNEYKLKKGFKQLFGNTVYGLLQEYRLQEAKILLEKNDINVSEAAILVGYKSIGHFSKIFKENFGILASDIMKNRKYY